MCICRCMFCLHTCYFFHACIQILLILALLFFEIACSAARQVPIQPSQGLHRPKPSAWGPEAHWFTHKGQKDTEADIDSMQTQSGEVQYIVFPGVQNFSMFWSYRVLLLLSCFGFHAMVRSLLLMFVALVCRGIWGSMSSLFWAPISESNWQFVNWTLKGA